jgi:uncharacterized OB-fold protein
MATRDMTQQPLPKTTEMSQPFWDATKEGRLSIQRCTTCGAYWWLPELACRDCRTETLEWTDVSGRGEVYSFVVLHQAAVSAFTAPYAVAVITLAEGPRFMADLVDVDPADVTIGMPVQVKFEDVGPVALPHFTPVNTSGAS